MVDRRGPATQHAFERATRARGSGQASALGTDRLAPMGSAVQTWVTPTTYRTGPPASSRPVLPLGEAQGSVGQPPLSEALGSIGRPLRSVGQPTQLETIHPLRLRLLLAIERTGSISAAAEACAIGQPSASMHLRTLEAAIGQRLVTRTPGGSSLTAAGQVVATHAVSVLTTLDGMFRTLAAPNGGELNLVTSLTAAVALIPGLLRQFSDLHPGVSVTVRTLPSQTVVREIARAEADVGIAGEVPVMDAVERTEILTDELVGIAPVGLVPVESGMVTVGELARSSLLVGTEGSSTRIVTERYLARMHYRPSRVCVFDSYEAIKHAVAQGLGVSFLSRRLVGAEVERGELMAFRVRGVEPMTRPLYLLKSPMREQTAAGSAFMAMLAKKGWAGDD